MGYAAGTIAAIVGFIAVAMRRRAGMPWKATTTNSFTSPFRLAENEARLRRIVDAHRRWRVADDGSTVDGGMRLLITEGLNGGKWLGGRRTEVLIGPGTIASTTSVLVSCSTTAVYDQGRSKAVVAEIRDKLLA